MYPHFVTENHLYTDGLDIKKLFSSTITYTIDKTPPNVYGGTQLTFLGYY